MIRVEYADGQQQLVRPYHLNKLLSRNLITGFERSDGWARLGEATLRNPVSDASYQGPERRTPSY